MLEIIALEIISIVSFIYSLLIVFMPFAPINQVFIVFLWMTLGAMVFALVYKKSKVYRISGILLLMPLILFNTPRSIYFIIMTSILIISYIVKSLGQGNHYEYARKLKESYIIYTMIAIFGLISKGFHQLMSHGIPFIIIYLLTTVILVRSIRHIESGMDKSKIRKVNGRYLGIISIISFIVTLDRLRGFIFSTIEKIYDFTITIVLKILYYPIILVAMIINKLLLPILGNFWQGVDLLDFQMGVPSPEEFEVIDVITKDSPILNIIIRFIAIVLLLYIVYKLIIKIGSSSHEGIEYTEEREYIKSTKKEKRRLKKEKYPEDLKEQIRYYYRRYLEKLEEYQVELIQSDTSLEINKKAEEVFKEDLEKVRSIYIHSRYGNKDVDKSMVEEMEKLYKGL